MRKIFIAITLFFSVHLIYGNEVDASTYNLLDLQNLHGPMDKLETIEPIEVEEGEEYTLIFSENFSYVIDEEYRQPTGVASIELIFGDDKINGFTWLGEPREYYNIIYYEFITLSNSLSIANIHFDGFSPEAVLIKGGIENFRGFYSYGENFIYTKNKTIRYEEVDSFNPEVYFLIGNNIPKTPTVTRNDLEKELGEHEIEYLALHNNKDYYFRLLITVIDDLAPVLLTNNLSYQIDQKPDLEQVLSDLSIVDNVTTIDRSHIEVLADEYSSASIPGTYNIKIKIKDDSNNSITEIVAISLLSDGKIILEGPMSHFYYKTNGLPTIEEISSHYKAYDPYTLEELTIKFTSIDYNHVNATPGNKRIKLDITDSSGVKHVKYINVIVIDDSAPVFVYNGAIIVLNANKSYEDYEIINLISEQLTNKEVVFSNLIFEKDELDASKLNITYINEDGDVVYDYVMIDYYNNDKTTIIIASAIGLVVLLTGVYFLLDVRKKKKRLKR